MTFISAIFFDLDGTLVDSSIGIHNAFSYTFKELGVPCPDVKTIRSFMGPPLESSFETRLPKEKISEAVQIYRSYSRIKESTRLNFILKSVNYSKNSLKTTPSTSQPPKTLQPLRK